MTYAPIARIALRYGVGLFLGAEAGDMLAGDADVVNLVAAGIGLVAAVMVEWWYARAKANGGAT